MKNSIWIAIITVFVLLSCEPNVPNLPETPSKIVLNGLITTDSLMAITLTRSTLVTDAEFGGEFLQNAQIKIYHNNKLIDTMVNREVVYLPQSDLVITQTNYYSKGLVPMEGYEYKLEVQYPNMGTIKAKTTLPKIVRIEKVDTTRIEFLLSDIAISNLGFLCHMSFTDPMEDENYYLFQIILNSGFFKYFRNMDFDCSHAIIEEEIKWGSATRAIAFSDRSINGEKVTLPFVIKCHDIGNPFEDYFDPENPHGRNVVHFRLYSINKDYFTYIQSLNQFYENYRNPLAEPSQVYSNIEGGYGIFAGAAVSSDSLVFEY